MWPHGFQVSNHELLLCSCRPGVFNPVVEMTENRSQARAAELVYHQVIIGGIGRTGVVRYLFINGAAELVYHQVIIGGIGRTVVVFINRGQQSSSITR